MERDEGNPAMSVRKSSTDDILRPPVPVPDCDECADLAGRRETAQADYDRSAEVDANVLMRQHQRTRHG